MADFEIKCGRCKLPVEHICQEDFKQALIALLQWVPGGYFSSERMEKTFKAESKEQGDEYDFRKMPFFGSQAWTYLIWHKEDARSFHAYLNNLIRAAGIDPHELSMEIEKEKKK